MNKIDSLVLKMNKLDNLPLNIANNANKEIIARSKYNLLIDLGIYSFVTSQISEIFLYKFKLEEIDNNKSSKANNYKNKKVLLKDYFDLISEHLKLPRLKLSFEKPVFDDQLESDQVFYNESLNQDSDTLISDITSLCLDYYLKNIYLYPQRIKDKNLYTILRLASLTNNQDILDVFIYQIENRLFQGEIDLKGKEDKDYSLEDIKTKVVKDYLTDASKIIKKLDDYTALSDLSFSTIKELFSLFAQDRYKLLSNTDKANLMSLVYDYFTYYQKDKYEMFLKESSLINSGIDALDAINDALIYGENDSLVDKIKKEKLAQSYREGYKYTQRYELNLTNVINIEKAKEVKSKIQYNKTSR